MFRAFLKEGPKRIRDFPYRARYHLERMVKGGFLIKVVKGVDVEELKRLRDEGFKNREIAEKLGISLTTIQYWVKKLNLKRKLQRRTLSLWIAQRNQLYNLLKRSGPMPKKEAMQALRFDNEQMETVLIMFPEEFQKLKFSASRRKHSKKFLSLVKACPVLTLKGDPRIIDFAASHIHMKVQTRHEAKAVVHLLRWQLGYSQARAVVKKLGYRYKEKAAGKDYMAASDRSIVGKASPD